MTSPPSIRSVPDYVTSAGAEAVELCEMAGLHLDLWQIDVLTSALGERADGSWTSFEVGLCVARQNGKSEIMLARELTGLFLLEEKLIQHSCHLFDSSLEQFRKVLFVIEETPDFDRRVMRVLRSHGEEGIELRGSARGTVGQRIRFRTRTKGGGRGFSGDCLVFDEAMDLKESSHGALIPTLSARPRVQVYYAGSAVDESVQENGVVFARVRERGIAGDDRLAYFEWSVPDPGPEEAGPWTPDRVTRAQAADREAWAQANPALGVRIDPEHIEAEMRSLDHRAFCVERLSIGAWPRIDSGPVLITSEEWAALEDEHSKLSGRPCFAFDVPPDRSWASISVAGKRSDGLRHIEVVDRRRGTGWVVERLAELRSHKPVGFVCDAAGPAASLLPELEQLGIEVTTVSGNDHAQACGLLFDLVQQSGLRHLGTAELSAAVAGATQRPLGDAWAWSRKSSAVDISPLVSVTLALWGAQSLKAKKRPIVMYA